MTVRGEVTRGIAGLHLSIVGKFLGRADPDQRFRSDAAFRVAVQSEEVHAHLRQLAEYGLISIAVPPIGPLGKIVERLNAPPLKQRLPRFVQCGPFP